MAYLLTIYAISRRPLTARTSIAPPDADGDCPAGDFVYTFFTKAALGLDTYLP
jgi:hypothetical protein